MQCVGEPEVIRFGACARRETNGAKTLELAHEPSLSIPS